MRQVGEEKPVTHGHEPALQREMQTDETGLNGTEGKLGHQQDRTFDA